MLILIRGAGDLASGIAHRLHSCGFGVVMTDVRQPLTVRCTVAFSRAVYEGSAVVEGVTARLAGSADKAMEIVRAGEIPVLIDPEATCRKQIPFDVVVDAILAKRNLGTRIDDAPVVIGVGPGFTAEIDCHAAVETKRGHELGKALYSGSPQKNTGVPGEIGGYTIERLLRAPCPGIFQPMAAIGNVVQAGQVVAKVEELPVIAAIGGVVRGILPAGTTVDAGTKAGDIDPRGIREHCFTISDKARAIAGGVLEAALHFSKGYTNCESVSGKE